MDLRAAARMVTMLLTISITDGDKEVSCSAPLIALISNFPEIVFRAVTFIEMILRYAIQSIEAFLSIVREKKCRLTGPLSTVMFAQKRPSGDHTWHTAAPRSLARASLTCRYHVSPTPSRVPSRHRRLMIGLSSTLYFFLNSSRTSM